MPRIVITHAVQDIERWLGGKAERADVSNGISNVTDLVAVDGSNHAAVVFDVADLESLKTLLAAMPPEMAAQAEAHGVVQPMTAYVEA
jgi:muconolactone delta-isomerase